jgi:hypothetical protein
MNQTSDRPRYRSWLRIAVVSLGIIGTGLVRAESLIVDNGRSRAEIIVAEQPTRSVRLGVMELQKYVQKITGAKLAVVTVPTEAMPVKIFVGDSDAARVKGVTAEGLSRDAFRMVSGDGWLALVGNDWDFQPIEPWARSQTDWEKNKEAEWQKLAGDRWVNPVGARIWRKYNKQLDVWNYDHRGSLNAVHEFLRSLGVRWYMPGELGEILPETKNIVLPQIDRTVRPAFEVRSIDRPLLSSPDIEDAWWYLRIGLNEQYGIMHHGLRDVTEPAAQRKAHPEYYALLPNGKRDTESDRPSACLSSPGLFQDTVDHARLMYDHYDVPIVSVMPEDGFNLCQCELCRDQATLDREPAGFYSDYVWKFVVRVANELVQSHPNKKVFCGAYSSYRLPPRSIDKLPDNVWVQITNGRPVRELDDKLHAETAELRRQWQEKTSHPLSVTLNFTPFINRGGEYRPQYWTHVIALGLRESSGKVWREDVWGSGDKGGLAVPSMSHVNYYFMSRLWWNPTQDVDALLAEYYPLFYGPAAEPMKAFIDFCEVNYAKLGEDSAITAEALSRFEQAKAAVKPESVYGRRIANVDEYLTTLRNRSQQINQARPEGLPKFRMIDMAQDKWRDVRDTLVMDGKVDEPFWTCYNDARMLKDARGGAKPKYETKFRARWHNGHVYLAVVCQGEPGKQPIIGTKQNRDPAIWDGEHLELLVETDKHSYYQLVVNAAGAEIDLDRGAPKAGWLQWSSQAEVAAHIGDGYWSAEIKLPITSSDEDPLHQIVGGKPFKAKERNAGKGANLPWHFNLFRNRAGSEDGETSAFSPIDPTAKNFHDRMRFAELYTQ